METLIAVVVMGIFFLGYGAYRIEAEIVEANDQLKQILKALEGENRHGNDD
jgi:hypothetical protein